MAKLAFVLLIISSLFFTGCQNTEQEAPKAENGVLELSNYTFGETDTVKLDGEWEFYWNQYLTPEDFSINSGCEKDLTGYINVPGTWGHSIDCKILPERGFGTYRLLIKMNSVNNEMGIKTTSIKFDNKIYIDGIEQIFHSDIQNQEVPDSAPRVIYFQNQGDMIEIIIQVINLEDVNGGIIQSIYLGSNQAITNKNMQLLSMDIIIFTCMIMLFLVLIVIFIAIGSKRKNNLLILILGMSCFFYAIVNSGMREKLLFQFIPWMPTEILYKITDICSICYFTSNLLFLFFIGREFCPQILRKVILSLFILQSIVILISPPNIYTSLLKEILLIDLLIIVIICLHVTRSVIKNVKHSLTGKIHIRFMTICFILPLFNIINMRIRLFEISVINYYIIANICLLIFILIVILFIVHGVYVQNRNIHKLSERLFVLDQLKDEFLANTFHQFKTPLNSIINITESIIEECSEICSKQEQNLSFIISISKRLSKLVDDIHDLIKLKSDEIKLSIDCVDIKARIMAAAEVLKILIRKKEISLFINVSDDLPNANADENRIYQIFNNLILNTVDFITKGTIEISASSYNEYIYITVLGVDSSFPHNQSTSDRYEQETNILNPDLERINLGLSISKKLAEMMGGALEIEYMIRGKGCKYILKLAIFHLHDTEQYSIRDTDVLKNADELGLEEIRYPLECVKGGKYNVLVVEDEISNTQILINLLTKEDCNVYADNNGFNALKRLGKENKFDIVILDAMISGISGYDVCRKIREEYSMLQLPILITTAIKSSDYIRIGYEAGANDFILKPFEATELKARVRTLLTQRKLMEESLANEIAFLQSQIKPHFLYNALSNIIAICYEDGDKAAEMLSSLSTYLKSIFRNSQANQIITIEHELEIINSYVEIEKLRLGDHLRFKVFIDSGIIEMGVQIPAFIIQPLIENAIRHGIFCKKAPGTVTLVIIRDRNGIKIIVEDDGIGMSDKELNLVEEKTGKGIGLRNVRRRVESMDNASFSIESQLKKGTRCSIILHDNSIGHKEK
jgi:two-component system, sensor histidine kinase ChiS